MVETLLDALPPRDAVRSEVSQIMLKPAGMRMRISLAAVMVGVPASSATVNPAIAVRGSPTVKL